MGFNSAFKGLIPDFTGIHFWWMTAMEEGQRDGNDDNSKLGKE